MNVQFPPNTPNSSRYKSQDLYSDSNVENIPNVKMDMAQERKTISHWGRDDLEDKYLRLLDDHQILKKHARLQEMKIKKLSTKLLKLTSDAKKNGDLTTKNDDSDDLLRKCSTYESQNSLLKDKVKLLQSQLLAQGKKPSVYDNVPSRIKSGYVDRSNSGQNSNRKNNIRVIKPKGEIFPLSPGRDEPNYAEQSNIPMNKVVDDLKYELHKKQIENEELVKQSYFRGDEQGNPDMQKSNFKDNLDLIRFSREVKDKEIQINVMQSKYEDLKLKQQHLERSNNDMADEIDRLNNLLRNTDNDMGNAQGQVRNASVLMKRISDMDSMNSDLKKEIYLLKESNNKLTNDAFNTERERDWREKESNYRAKILQLEMTLKRDVGEKGGVLNKLESERGKSDSAEKELSNLRLKNYELQSKIEELSEKLKFFSKDTSLNPQEIEEALMIIQQKRNLAHAQSTPELDFLEKVDKRKDQDVTRRLQESEMNHADTIQELEKTRSLLRTQYKITNDYRLESEKISSRLEEVRKDYEDRLTEYARLLDIRAARIQKLEAQLKDIAYGTRNTQIETLLDTDLEPLAPEILERGENILEVHIGRICLTQQAIESIKDKEPLLFGTWDFYDFETQATGVLRGTNSEFDIKAEYLVKIDDFFLNYLYKNSFSFELHQATGAEYLTLAACQLSCRDLFDRPIQQDGKHITRQSGLKYNCKAKLVGIRENAMDINFGVLEYWIRLKHPMEQVIRQYREKLKAEGYITGNNMAITEAGRPIDSMNELVIRIVRCKGLKSRQKHLQPSPYIAYTFYDHNAHTTITIPSSNNPEFHDLKRFPVQMNSDLHQYLKSQNLAIYVFDELDPDESSYLGIASIPMIQLCHNKNISGSFELYDISHMSNGTLEIDVDWQHSYLYQDVSFDNPKNAITLLPGEENIANENQPSRQTAPSKLENKLPIEKSERKSLKKSEEMIDQLDSKVIEKPLDSKVIEQPKKKERNTKPTSETPLENGFVSPPNVPVVKSILRKTKPKEQPEKPLSESLKDKETLDNLIMDDVEMKVASPVESSSSIVEEQIKPANSLDKSLEIKRNLDAVANKLDKTSMRGDDSLNSNNALNTEQPSSSTNTTITNKTPSVPEESGKKKKKPSKKDQSKNVKINGKQQDNGNVASENDDVIIDNKKKKPVVKSDLNPDEIVVEIINVDIENKADILKDEAIQNIFVEYRIPGITSELTETISLKKPAFNHDNKIMNYNFKKTFDVSFSKNYMIRQHVATMLTEDSNKYIVFTLVNEPGEEGDSDCEDIGTARVNVLTLLKEQKNLENERIPIYSAKNNKVIIGHINISIKILGVLQAIEKELKKA